MKFPSIVKDWLTEFKIDKDGYSHFYTKYFGNTIFSKKLIKCLEHKLEVESICHQIYNLGLLKTSKLNILLLDIIPNILSFYLSSLPRNDRAKKTTSDESTLILRSCLISVRNILHSRFYSDQYDIFDIPVFTDGSIYHSPIIRPDIDIFNHSIGDKVVVKLSGIDEKSDFNLLPDILKIYNLHLSCVSAASLASFCHLSVQIASVDNDPRMPVTSSLLEQLIGGVQAAICRQETVEVAYEALTAVEGRACFELMPEVLLQVGAVRRGCFQKRSSSGTAAMEIVVAMEPASRKNTRAISIGDALITNATFRPEKIAEDIDVTDIAVVVMPVSKTDKHSARAAPSSSSKKAIKFSLAEATD